ncbi:hypothetical protein [Enterococcus lactis]|uniref:hypothetical protein n=2 Tax=Enterococcus lactis TaxID=357441 RepID=UPI0022E2EB72|nr:hypothetical protein [Enterococcus lactis]
MDTDKQKEQKISLYIDKGLEFDQYKEKHYTNYLTAITDTVFKHAPQISDKNIQQQFFENFTAYLSPETKEWALWEDFQKVSRKFEELKLENICENLNITFDSESIDSEKKKFDGYLYNLRGQIAVEVAKTSPVVELNLYYDPEFLHAMEAVDGSVGATELIMIVEDWQESVYEMECNIANGVEGSYSSQVLRYVYHNNEGLEGKIYLYNEQKEFVEKMTWERDEDLATVWQEECQTTCLTLAPTQVAKKEPTQQLKDLSNEQKHSVITRQQEASDTKAERETPLENINFATSEQTKPFSKERDESIDKKDDKKMYMDRNPELWKISVNDFGMDLRPVEQLTQPKGLHPNKSAQLTGLASRHHQKPLSDFITAANVQHKADDQLNNRQQNSPTKQNVSTNIQKEISLIKVEPWGDSNESKQGTDVNQRKKRVGQLIKTWETRSQTTSVTTLDSRKQGLGQLLEDVTTRKSYPSGEKKQVIPNKNLSLSKTQPHAEF